MFKKPSSPIYFYLVSGYSSGAPDSQCGSLTPGHGFDSEDITTAPFTVQVIL